MASSYFLSLTILLSLSYVIFAVDDDVIIRQVVDTSTSTDSNTFSIDDLLLNADHHFSLFKAKFDKRYASQEEDDHRLKIFKANLRRAKRNQEIDPSAVHGVTKFSDLTAKEFKEKYLGFKDGKKKKLRIPSDAEKAPTLPTKDLPEDFDWRDHGAVTPVKNQGSCGSCWSFSTTGALEGAHFLATGELVSLSEQQLVDCDHECDPEEYNSCDAGFNGGLMNNAFEYILKAGGVLHGEDLPLHWQRRYLQI